jgi:anti-sigma B factor antagonist
MFEIKFGEQGEIVPIGRFDASRVKDAASVFDAVTKSTTVDMAKLDYISSVGIGILVATQKRLSEAGEKLELVNTNDRIKSVFQMAGLADVFGVE